jgi:hypothetical protein
MMRLDLPEGALDRVLRRIWPQTAAAAEKEGAIEHLRLAAEFFLLKHFPDEAREAAAKARNLHSRSAARS